MAISTYKVFLMKKADTGEQWSKLIDEKHKTCTLTSAANPKCWKPPP